MRSRRVSLVVLSGLALLFASALAVAQEGEPGQRPPRPPRPGGEGRPGLQQPGALGQRGAGPFAADTPEIREEMKRHMEAMQAILEELRPLGQQVRQKIRELRQQGADREAIREALRDYAPQGQELAGKIADAVATHHENMAKLYKEDREAVARSIAVNILRRLAVPGGPGRRPGAEGERPLPPRRAPRGGDGGPAPGGAPENF